MYEVRLIPIADIEVWASNPSRRTRPGASWAEFVAHLQRYGQLAPVVVVLAGNGRYQLIDGHRRLAALRDLGRTVVLAHVSNLSFAEAVEAYGKAEQLKLAWSGRDIAEFPARLGWDLALSMLRAPYRRTFARALASARDPGMILAACRLWGPRALERALTIVDEAWPLDRILAAMLRHGSYRDLEDQTKGLPQDQRRRQMRAILARWETGPAGEGSA